MLQNIRAYLDYQPIDPLVNFVDANAERIIRSYYFTSELSRLTARLIEGIASLKTPEAARLITGARGTGKSHTLAVVRALACTPKTRHIVAHNPPLANAVKRLEGTTFLPVYISGKSLVDGSTDFATLLRDALARIPESPIAFDDAQWFPAIEGQQICELLASRLFPGMAFLFVIDDLSDALRAHRRALVQDTLDWLTKLAEKSRSLPFALLVALDSDVTAPHTGPAARLTADYQTDTLTLDNLRRITDQAVFRKTPQQRAELTALYQETLKSLPRFHWSEEEFCSLYPVHPAVLEVAPGLSTYCESFSLFSFINAVIGGALRRRPMQLISLDDLFDKYDFELKRHPTLSRAVAVYEYLSTMRLPSLSFEQRIPAKLLLKGLFLYSLVGRPVSADELTNAMMLGEIGYNQAALLLDDLQAHSEGQIIKETAGGVCRYSLTVVEQFDPEARLKTALAETPDDDTFDALLVTLGGGAAFYDFPFTLDALLLSGAKTYRDETVVLWRNTGRRGIVSFGAPPEIFTNPPVGIERSGDPFTPVNIVIPTDDEAGADAKPSIVYHWADELCEYDWQLCIESSRSPMDISAGATTPSLLYWRPSPLSATDLETLKSLWIAYTRGEEVFGDELAERVAVLEAQTRAMFLRHYVEEGELLAANGERYALRQLFPDGLPRTFSDFLGTVIRKPLDIRFPAHPVFSAPLTERETKRLVLGLLGGLNPTDPTVQEMARHFAAPFQIVVQRDGLYQLAMDRDEALGEPCISEVLRLVEAAGSEPVPVQVVYQTLRREPYGLLEPAQQIVMMALVAGWRIELVDVSGLRIFTAAELTQDVSFRQYGSIRRTAAITYASETLSEWCRLLTERFDLPDLADDRKQVRESLAQWYQKWLNYRLAERFENLPPEMLTTRTWQLIITCKRYFETTAAAVEAVLFERISLEMGLARIVDIFAANPTIYQRAVIDLRVLVEFLDWLPFYVTAKAYTLSALPVTDADARNARRELGAFFEHPHRLLDADKRLRFEQVFERFKKHYIEDCVAHDEQATKNLDLSALTAFLASPTWRLFENLSRLVIADGTYAARARRILADIELRRRSMHLRTFLEHQPLVSGLIQRRRMPPLSHQVERLRETVQQGIQHFRQCIAQNRAVIQHHLRALGLPDVEERMVTAALAALTSTASQTDFSIAPEVIDHINAALTAAHPASPVIRRLPLAPGVTVTKADLAARLTAWLEELPEDAPVTLEVEEGFR
ncbi:MAG: DUF6079 family protein [Chloracidobacterium sp.]|nr:DUF6079 family protein [Chloracidobacterium sp.]MDW8217915.1 DUF6079 family protein [Acidobacteriota bacterium]